MKYFRSEETYTLYKTIKTRSITVCQVNWLVFEGPRPSLMAIGEAGAEVLSPFKELFTTVALEQQLLHLVFMFTSAANPRIDEFSVKPNTARSLVIQLRHERGD